MVARLPWHIYRCGTGWSINGTGICPAGVHDTSEAANSCAVLGVTEPRPTALLRARPNPFIRETEFQFGLTQGGVVRLRIHDLFGRVVRELQTGSLEPGLHRLVWDGRNREGRRLAPGTSSARMDLSGAALGSTRIVLIE